MAKRARGGGEDESRFWRVRMGSDVIRDELRTPVAAIASTG